MLNSFDVSGRFAETPELRKTDGDILFVKFNIAVERNFRKPDEPYGVDFFTCVAWREKAEFICSNFTKGQQITLHGYLQNRSYTDKEGNSRRVAEIIVTEAYFCGSKPKEKDGQEETTGTVEAVPAGAKQEGFSVGK